MQRWRTRIRSLCMTKNAGDKGAGKSIQGRRAASAFIFRVFRIFVLAPIEH